MLPADLEPVADPVGDDEQRAGRREVGRALEQIDPRLEDSAAAAAHADPAGDLLRAEIAGVVRRRVAEDDADCRDVPRGCVARDGSEVSSWTRGVL